MVEFAGWEMPLQYAGIIPEHHAVRNHVGIFDVSHMGRILVHGLEAESFLNYISTNIITGKPNLSATYTTLCNDHGGCVDDVIIYKFDPHHFFLIVNAGNREKDLEHLKLVSAAFNVDIQDRFQEDGILSIQGPSAKSLVSQLFPETPTIKPMHFIPVLFQGQEIILSNSGYTGAGGLEIYAANTLIIELWRIFLQKGKQYSIMPIGLGARDTLRLEMGYALYGHELTDTIAPIESVASWTVHLDKMDFFGKDPLLALKNNPSKRNEYGIIMIGEGIARSDYPVVLKGKKIGIVTSGTFSPTLGKAIAIILVEGTLTVDDIVEIQIRQHLVQAKVVKLPFLQ